MSTSNCSCFNSLSVYMWTRVHGTHKLARWPFVGHMFGFTSQAHLKIRRSLVPCSSFPSLLVWQARKAGQGLGTSLEKALVSVLKMCMKHISLIPSPSPHVRERRSGVLNEFSCHMGQGSSPIWELESDSRTHNYMCMTKVIVFWTELEVEKTYLAARSQLSQELCGLIKSL